MADLRVELEEILEGLESGSPRFATPALGPTLPGAPWLLAGVGAAMLVGLWLVVRPSPRPAPTRFPATSLEGYELEPALSPDGRQVAFLWDGGVRSNPLRLYVKLLTGGTPLRLTEEGGVRSPAWSPDGTEIGFLRKHQGRDGFDVLTISALGGSERRVATTASNYRGLDWSPSGELLAFSDRTPEGPVGIYLLAMDTGGKDQLTSPSSGERPLDDSEPVFSPGGGSVAFLRKHRDGGGTGYPVVRSLTGGRDVELNPSESFVWDLQWRADGRTLVYSTGRSFDASYLTEVPAKGGSPRRLFLGDRARGLSIVGSRLVYSEHLDDNNLWRIPGPASSETRAREKWCSSTRDEWGPHYSPDGTRVAFVSDRGGTWEIWTCSADGDDPRPLTDLGHAIFPRFSPGGDRVAFSSVAGGDGSAYVVPASGGFPSALIEDGDDAFPSWSPSGNWVYYQSNHPTEGWRLWKRPLPEGAPVRLSEGAAFRPLTEDDESVFFWRRNGIWRVLDGREEEITTEKRVGLAGWDLWRGQLVYVDDRDSGPSVIEALDVAAGRTRELLRFEETPEVVHSVGVSPDGQWVLYVQRDVAGSDLVVVDDFR